MHDFKNSLIKGIAGEELLVRYMPELERLGGRKADFRHKQTGELYELKTDSYDMNKTKNFFLELFSDVDKRSVGGPAQAASHGSKYWMYLFSQNNTLFVFDTDRLVQWIRMHGNDYPWKYIENNGWITAGIAVPRETLSHLYYTKELK